MFNSRVHHYLALAACLNLGWAGPVVSQGFDITLEQVASGFHKVSAVAQAGDGSQRLFVAEREGAIRVVLANGQVLAAPFLDLESSVESEGIEQGLLGLAFHPAYTENGLFYVAYTDLAGDAVVARYERSPIDPNQADALSGVEVLFLEQPSALHNIHELAFGPDGYLFVGSGDGGPAGDPDGTGQSLAVLLGKLLRLDVDPDLFPAGGYGIPPDNPFVDTPGAQGEIWAYGLRNPANFSFDFEGGGLFIADVGQDLWEEVNFAPANAGGRNYGWSTMEGTHCFNPPVGCDRRGLTLPVGEYPQNVDEDCAVIGGYVYRGQDPAAMDGWYLFGDFCSGKIRGLRAGCGGWAITTLLDAPFRISALGQDASGMIYVAEWSTQSDGGLYRVAGVPASVIFSDGFESSALEAWSTCVSWQDS